MRNYSRGKRQDLKSAAQRSPTSLVELKMPDRDAEHLKQDEPTLQQDAGKPHVLRTPQQSRPMST